MRIPVPGFIRRFIAEHFGQRPQQELSNTDQRIGRAALGTLGRQLPPAETSLRGRAHAQQGASPQIRSALRQTGPKAELKTIGFQLRQVDIMDQLKADRETGKGLFCEDGPISKQCEQLSSEEGESLKLSYLLAIKGTSIARNNKALLEPLYRMDSMGVSADEIAGQIIADRKSGQLCSKGPLMDKINALVEQKGRIEINGHEMMVAYLEYVKGTALGHAHLRDLPTRMQYTQGKIAALSPGVERIEQFVADQRSNQLLSKDGPLFRKINDLIKKGGAFELEGYKINKEYLEFVRNNKTLNDQFNTYKGVDNNIDGLNRKIEKLTLLVKDIEDQMKLDVSSKSVFSPGPLQARIDGMLNRSETKFAGLQLAMQYLNKLKERQVSDQLRVSINEKIEIIQSHMDV